MTSARRTFTRAEMRAARVEDLLAMSAEDQAEFDAWLEAGCPDGESPTSIVRPGDHQRTRTEVEAMTSARRTFTRAEMRAARVEDLLAMSAEDQAEFDAWLEAGCPDGESPPRLRRADDHAWTRSEVEAMTEVEVLANFDLIDKWMASGMPEAIDAGPSAF